MRDVDLTDSNGNGIPDVFEHRRSISEILNSDDNDDGDLLSAASMDQPHTVILELEIGRRPPLKGEIYYDGFDGTVRIKRYGESGMAETIVKRIVRAPSYWKPIID